MDTTTSARRLLFLTCLAALLGIIGGLAAWLLLHLIGLITNLALFHQWGWEVPNFSELFMNPLIIVAAVLGATAVSLIAKWAPVIRGHGIPEAMEAVLTKQSRISPRAALAKPTSSAIAIGTGGPFGAEGPIIVTGGAVGSLLGQVIRMSPSERKILLACGAAAGMAATFGAPLASVILAIELLLFEFSTRAFIPLVVSAAVAGGMHAALIEAGPLFEVPSHDYAGLGQLPAYALLGLACGLLAVVICKGLFLFEAGFRRLPVGEFWHPIIGAVGFGIVGLAVPRALGVGYDAISDILSSRLTIAAVALLAGGKLLAWWIALSSGTSGGTLAPILLISAGFGTLFGELVNAVIPGLEVSPGAFALVAMAATFGSATRASLTAMVFVFELTRDYEVILPLMIATVLANLLAGALMRDSIMTEKLTRRGLHVHTDYEPDRYRTTGITQIMTTEVQTVTASTTIAAARDLLTKGAHSAYPLVDDAGNCVGIISRGDLLTDAHADDAPVSEAASTDVVSVKPTDVAATALQRMLDEGVDHLPVIEGADGHGRLCGIVTRTDILAIRKSHLEHERPQHGWRIPRQLPFRRPSRQPDPELIDPID